VSLCYFPFYHSLTRNSVWPAGIAGSAQGTIDWAGGMIDWTTSDYTAAGQYYALVNSVEIKCTNAQTVPANSDIVSYSYAGNRSSTNPTIVYTNHTTLLNAAGRLSPVGGATTAVFALVMGLVLALNAVVL
jgi:hypothetical protein